MLFRSEEERRGGEERRRGEKEKKTGEEKGGKMKEQEIRHQLGT